VPVVPTSHTFVNGVADFSEMNSYVRDPIDFLQRRPVARLRRTVAQSIPNGTFTDVLFDVEDFDTAGGHDNVTNPARYTAQYAGRYLIGYHSAFAASAVGVRTMRLAINGAAVAGTNNLLATVSAASGSHFTGSAMVTLNVGDFVTVQVFQSTGGALDQEVSADSGPTMDVIWEGSV
jgi:hypothetical protein